MQSITLLSEEHKELIRLMKRERKPSHRLRMHIVVLASDGYSPTQISRVLFCSRTTVYAIIHRFCREGRAAFYDRKRRGPRALLDESAQKRIETLVEEDSPTEHGWLRSRWSCPAPQPRDGSPYPAPPGLPLEEATSSPTLQGPRAKARKTPADS
jgi:DNA-binding CsgD family transcriptional regulator